MTEDNVPLSTPRGRQRSWVSERFVELLQRSVEQPVLDEGVEFVRRRRVGELQAWKGGFSLRITADKTKPARVRLLLPPFAPTSWEHVARELSRGSRLAAALLNSDVPEELETVCERIGLPFVPAEREQLEITCDCGLPAPCGHQAALTVVLSDKLEANPSLYLLFRGIECEELLRMLREFRREWRSAELNEEQSPQTINYERSRALEELLPNFFDATQGFNELHYDIRADELPASLFRRLDPLPIAESSTALELALEDLYGAVASRAQALGLGL